MDVPECISFSRLHVGAYEDFLRLCSSLVKLFLSLSFQFQHHNCLLLRPHNTSILKITFKENKTNFFSRWFFVAFVFLSTLVNQQACCVKTKATETKITYQFLDPFNSLGRIAFVLHFLTFFFFMTRNGSEIKLHRNGFEMVLK